MKFIFLLDYIIIQTTIIYGSNQYLGCFIDQIGNRDLSVFIGEYEQLTPKQCILLCHERNFNYAAIQYGNECRCGQQYGNYGQVSEDECDQFCSTSEKCGGDRRNSVYSVINSLDEYKTTSICQNNLVGYHGCFGSTSLQIEMDIVNSIKECVKRCAVKYNYAGITNGNLCYCGNELTLSSSNSDLCHISCNKSFNAMNIDCCGGLDAFSVYNVQNYQSSVMNELFETIIRVKRADAVNDSTHTSSYTTYASSTLPVQTSMSSYTVTVTAITSRQLSITSSAPAISSSFHSDITSTNSSPSVLFTTSRMNSLSSSVHSSLMMSTVTPTTPISSTHIAETLLTTSHVITSTAFTSVVKNTIAISTSSIGIALSSTNLMATLMSSFESSSMHASMSTAGISSSLHIFTSEKTATTEVSTPSVIYSSLSSLHADTTYQTSIAAVSSSSLHTISSQTSSHMGTSITNPVILNSIHTDTITQSVTTLHSSAGTSPISTMMSTLNSSSVLSSPSTHLSETSTVPMSSSSIASYNPTSFSTITFTESSRASPIISTYSSQITTTVSEQSSSGQSIVNTSPSSTQSLTSSSANVRTQPTITSFLLTGATNQTTVAMITNATGSSVSTTMSTTISTSQTTSTILSYVISTIIIVPWNQTFDPNNNTTRESLRQKFIQIINFAFRCIANSSYPNCTQTRQRIKRQICSSGYDVNLVSNITEISNSTSTKYQTNYTVLDPCNSNTLVAPTQVKIATDTLSRAQITRILGYDYDGDLIKSTSIVNTDNPTPDRKLWLIGAVLGPVVFALLLIFIFCYLHFKCRPRHTTNPVLVKSLQNAPVSNRLVTDQIVSNGATGLSPPTEKTTHVLIQNDPLVGVPSTSVRRLTSTESDRSSHHILQHPVSADIPIDEIRHQNDVERWRNKLRLQEKFQQPSIGYQDSSVPNTGRSSPYQYDNRSFDHDQSYINTPPVNGMISNRSSHRTPRSPEIEAGRTKLHRLLDEVLDKADSEEIYNPDSEIERQKRRRQRRRIPSISNDPRILPLSNITEQIPHIPVIPQVSERPDPSLLRLRYNPYEAGDRAHDISRLRPVELTPKYDIDDQRSTQYTARSNPPLFYDDSNLPDRAATATNAYASPKRTAKTRLETDHEAVMRHTGGNMGRRQHKFNDDAVYIDPISTDRGQTRTAWIEPEITNDLSRRNDYRDEYIMAKRSVLNTRNIISSIHDELQHIVLPTSQDYYA